MNEGEVMNTNHADVPWLPKEFFENVHKYPLDELAKYCGQYIAWNWTGDTILDSDPDQAELWAEAQRAGNQYESNRQRLHSR